MESEAEEARRFLDSFIKEFPTPLGPEDPLPLRPLSSAVSLEEVQGESLELGLRLLQDRNAPQLLSVALTRAAVSEILQSDLSAFHKKQDEEEEEEAVLLEPDPLQRFFFNRLLELCCTWLEELPPLQPGARRFLQTSAHAIRNTRRKMEDRHVAIPEFNMLCGLEDQTERGYFAVFDGHGGVDAAVYAATHLHINLAQQAELLSSPGEALKKSFRQTDDMFLQKAKRERLRSGSTGVAALLSGDWLHIAWLGDSQVMLVRQGQVVSLMEPHKPEREDEKERIEALGGCVAFMGCWRVNGTIAVSRAIGDIDQKPYISGDADGASFQLHGSEDYLLLACDGFFDTVRPLEAAGMVLEHLRESRGVGSRVAERLVSQAKSNGSSDNITVLVVFLKEPGTLLSEAGERPAPL
ncbi:protein phosphatase 1F-like [Polyodon spathula]|uniref:protein phosphatase 1F-like n=1 Tax=Polyodon spathula TaxID=7913 RepID=UPI001B7E8F37|nr:protein phosphatase 1F-like [Polyodon spathula]